MGKIVMESTTSEKLWQIKLKIESKDTKIKEFNEKICMITEEKMEMKIKNDKIIADLELSKKTAEDNFLSQQEVAKETIWKLEEAMSLQKQQHLFSTETSKEILKSMDTKLSGREKELNRIQSKCPQNEEELKEREKEIRRLRKESECNEMEMEEKMKDISRREMELIREKDMKIKEHADSINSLKSKISSLQNEICEMMIVMESMVEKLNDIQCMFLQNVEKLTESEKETVMLRKERECKEVEMNKKLKLIHAKVKENNDMLMQKDTTIREGLLMLRRRAGREEGGDYNAQERK